MTNFYVFIDVKSFGVKNAEAVTAIRSALEAYNQNILQEHVESRIFALLKPTNAKTPM